MKNQFNFNQYFDIVNYRFKDIFTAIDNIWEVLPKIRQYIERQFKNTLSANYKNNQFVFIGEGTFIHETADIVGPAIIGKNCVLSHGSLIRENCLIGDNVHIGHGVEVKNSILLNNVILAHLNYIGDSIIGNRVNIAGGTMLANFRLDKKPVRVKLNKTIIETHLEKFGSVVGDDSNIGVNSVLNPGTILGKNSIVYPLVSVRGFHNDSEIIRTI